MKKPQQNLLFPFVSLTGADQAGGILGRAFGQQASLGSFLNTIFHAAVVIGAMLAVLRLVYAGYLYMTTDLPGQKQSAKTVLGETVLGLVLLLCVYLILNEINPSIVNLGKVQLKKVDVPASQQQNAASQNSFLQNQPNNI